MSDEIEITTTDRRERRERRGPAGSVAAPDLSWPLVERRRRDAPPPGGFERRRNAAAPEPLAPDPSPQLIHAPVLAPFRWAALVVGLIGAANDLRDNWWPTAPILIILAAYTTYVTVRPIPYRDDRRTRTLVSVEVLIHLGAVMFTGNWTSPFVFTLIPSTLLAGFASGPIFAFQTIGVTAAIVSVRHLSDSGVNAGLRHTTAWCGVLALVALTSGLARRVSEESQRQQAIALDRLTRLSEANALLFSLQRVAQSLPASLDLDDVLDSTLTRVRSLIEADVVAMLLYSESDRTWEATRLRGVWLDHGLTTDELPEPLRDAMTASRTISVDNLEREGPGLNEEMGSGLYASLRARGALVGLIAIEARAPRHFTVQHAEVLNGLIEPFGIAIDNARLFRRLRSVGADEERSRIARELHDRVGNAVALAGFEVDRISGMVRQGNDPSEDLAQLREQIRAVTAELRQALYDLRTDVSDERDLPTTIELFLERVRGRSSLEIQFESKAPIRLPILQERELWQIAREAITNIERHAQATKVRVEFTSTSSGASLVVSDNGKGFARGAGRVDSYGMVGMRERVASISGRIDIDSAPGAGTTIRVALDNNRGGNL